MAFSTTGNVSTVFGDMRIVMGTVSSVDNTGDEFDTGLNYVHYCGMWSQDAAVAIRIARNSNDGTEGTSNGEVWAVLSAGTDDCTFIAIGK